MKNAVIYSLALLCFAGCKTPNMDKRPSLTKIQDLDYKSSSVHVITLTPKYEVFHIKDSVSELFFKISSKELLYTKREGGDDFTSNCSISYQLIASYDSKEIIDSNSVQLVDVNNDNADKYLTGKINMKIFPGQKRFLQITFLDVNRNMKVSNTIEINKLNNVNRQNFLVKAKASTIPLFKNYVRNNDTLIIQYKNEIPAKIYVSYYNRNFPLVPPPFSILPAMSFQYKPDSFFVIQLSPKGTFDFATTKKGFFHFQLDTNKHDGLTLFSFPNSYFPEVKKAEDMLYPLRFITSKEEYDSIAASRNIKAAIENFWLAANNNDKERTRETIRKYYTRVKKANEIFSSYIEGWRTDRGMIYLIYGTPGNIFKTENYETWTYADMTFSFVKVNNPFTNNDFMLQRAPAYKQSWFLAVDVWRTGKAYDLE